MTPWPSSVHQHRRAARWWSSQAGLLGGIDALAFGTLVFITGTLLVLNAWSVLDSRMALSAAAREAVRTVVEAPADQLHRLDDLGELARARAMEALVQHGKDVDPSELVVRFEPITGALRCAPVTVHVTWRADVVALPVIGVFGDGIEVTVHHTGRIDPFRAGLPGEVACA